MGDEYLHRKPLNDVRLTVYTYEGNNEARQDNAMRVRKKVVTRLPIPIASDAKTRSEKTLDCSITTISTLWKDIPRVEYRITVPNAARDHRLRVYWSLMNADRMMTEGAFDVMERPAKHPLESEGALPYHPQQFWTDVSGSWEERSGETEASEEVTHGWTVINRGLPECELYTETLTDRDHHYFAVTLLRCVGYLSRRGDGPQFETPEAQCLGEHTFDLAVFEHDGDWKEAKVWKQAHQFNVPLRAVQTTDTPDDTRDLPPSLSFVTVEPDTLVVTAIKRAEDDPNTLIIRCFNITDEPITNGRIAVPGATSAHLVNLNEETQEECQRDANDIVVLPEIRPKQIITTAWKI